MKKTTKTTKTTSKKINNQFTRRQHEIGKIFRSLMKQGFDAQTSIKVALEETSDYSK